MELLLLKFALPELDIHWPEKQLLFLLPKELLAVLHENFLPSLSSKFSNSAHDGPFEVAFHSGLSLLALYLIMYPKNYPQIGIITSAARFLPI